MQNCDTLTRACIPVVSSMFAFEHWAFRICAQGLSKWSRQIDVAHGHQLLTKMTEGTLGKAGVPQMKAKDAIKTIASCRSFDWGMTGVLLESRLTGHLKKATWKRLGRIVREYIIGIQPMSLNAVGLKLFVFICTVLASRLGAFIVRESESMISLSVCFFSMMAWVAMCCVIALASLCNHV